MATNKTKSEELRELENAKKSAKEAYSSFLEAQDHLKSAAVAAGVDLKETANEQLDAVLGKASEKKAKVIRETSEYIIENPITSAGIAFLSGYLLSKLLDKS